jgi:hypothetical protein
MGEFSFVVLGADENTSAQIAATQQETEMDTPTYLATTTRRLLQAKRRVRRFVLQPPPR